MICRKLWQPATRVWPLLVAALLVASVGGTTAASDRHSQEAVSSLPDMAPPAIDAPISDAELADLKTVASQKGMSLQAAIDRYAWNDNFALAVDRVRTASPDTFADAAIVDAYNAWISFRDSVSDAAWDPIDEFRNSHPGVSLDIRTDAVTTETEIQAGIEAVHYALLDGPQVLDASTSYDSRSKKITTTVVLEHGASASVIDDLRAIARQELVNATRADILEKIDVAVIRSDQPAIGGDESSTEHLGGEDIGCTSAFGIKEFYTNDRGVSTAGHCIDIAPLHDDGVLLYIQGTYKNSTYGDFLWYVGVQPMGDDFYAGSSSSTETDRRDLASVGVPVVGQTLCRNGAASHKDCQEVRKLNVCEGSACSLVEMGEHLSTGGDSGAPVFWNYTAYGIHHGWVYDPSWPFDREVFSRADLIDDALSVYIATN